MSSRSFTTRVLKHPDELQTIATEWRQLWGRCPEASIFQSPEWLLSWIEVFRPRQIVAIEVRSESEIVGLAPLLVYPSGSEQVLSFLGGGVSDYLDVLADPQMEMRVVESIWQAMSEQAAVWTMLDLTDLPANSALLKAPQFARHSREHDTTSALALPRTRDELLQLLSRRQRANLRNARSRLQKAGGGQVELASPGTLSEFLTDLFRLHTARWSDAGQPGVLHDESIQAFHRRAAPRLLERGWLRLYRLRRGDRTLAVVQSFFEHDTVFCYLQGYDPEFAYFSPGTQLMFAVMEDGVRSGMRMFDFLRGLESYKQHWRAGIEPTFRIQLSRALVAAAGPSFTTAA